MAAFSSQRCLMVFAFLLAAIAIAVFPQVALGLFFYFFCANFVWLVPFSLLQAFSPKEKRWRYSLHLADLLPTMVIIAVFSSYQAATSIWPDIAASSRYSGAMLIYSFYWNNAAGWVRCFLGTRRRVTYWQCFVALGLYVYLVYNLFIFSGPDRYYPGG